MAATANIRVVAFWFLFMTKAAVVVRGLLRPSTIFLLRLHTISRVRIVASSSASCSSSTRTSPAAASDNNRRSATTTTTTMSNTASSAAAAAAACTEATTTISSWRLLLEKSSESTRSIRGSNYVQLATVVVDTTTNMNHHEPRVRSVVFRGFLKLATNHPLYSICDDLSCVFQMCTNEQSEKVEQVKQNPAAELLWWFPTTNEQYRVRGTIVFVGNGQFPLDDDAALKEARCNQWIRLTDAARDSFLCRDVVPGAAYNESCSTSSKSGPFVDENQKSNAVAPPDGKDASTGDIVLPPPDNFLLMLLLPKHVDYLRLGEVNYRQVDERNQMDGTWSSQRVNP